MQDNRLRFPPTLIDFANDVGTTGQDHDNYPQAGTAARFDHMRMYCIALLAQQSSNQPPTEYRIGTPWLDTQTMTLKIWDGYEWAPYPTVLELESGLTLDEWYQSVSGPLTSLSPEITYSGSVSSPSVGFVTIPSSVRSQIRSDSRAFVYRNGLLLDPRLTTIEPNHASVRLNGITLVSGDEFTVSIRRVPDSTFYTTDVVL